jgi:hypothetical protein
MLTSEEAAKTKTCPQTFAVREVRGADSSGIREGGPWTCLGTGCMAWRWHDGRGVMDRKGFCGLAGQPNKEAA